ncbi:GNAT family N-acetyltransferase [Clostridium folliculivorans]|uniref:N-acetyltransferase n=1 Tax=Clostridium folliculivorans TaxID=2886038 RepID=A0A9W5Y198_9CLOT|nr:GNAT family N-acetyltransferase [Clostridium folliculivorans]GKU24709.1 N-acetyltransferase [Clostridium folliculivorans]GKU30807.1 N-acetyltransferase [Clostridium folliculivorans]
MIKIKRLCFDKNRLINLFERSKSFNSFNNSFIKFYKSKPPIIRLLLLRNIRFIYLNKKVVGYFWFEKIYEKTYSIKDFVVNTRADLSKALEESTVKNGFFSKGLFIYECEDNSLSNIILTTLGFKKSGETLLMEKSIEDKYIENVPSNITFRFMENNKDENLRCNLQNNIFEDDSRIPLTIDDIYYDQCQDYYLENASIFIKDYDECVGYGQIILNNDSFFIVNLGIVKEQRGKGFSTYLLNYLIKVCYDRGIKKIYIRVDQQNAIAKKLYLNNGFKFVNMVSIWEQ